MELKFVAAKKPEAVNVTVQRRQRLVRRLDQQISLIQNAKDGFLPRTSWVWIDGDGAYFLAIKYGRNPIELKKGIFRDFLEEVDEDVLPNDLTGYRDSVIWNKLFNYQKDAATGIINKLETYNGCILADSVGLGKTFTALAVIKYYELRNRSVLVLCPKKLADNWRNYHRRADGCHGHRALGLRRGRGALRRRHFHCQSDGAGLLSRLSEAQEPCL